MVFRQADDNLKSAISQNFELFSTLVFSCGGTPRMLLKTIQDLPKFNTTSIDQMIKAFYRNQIWSEHTELGDKYKGHKTLIDWGRDFLENFCLPAIMSYNSSRKEKGVDESSIYFWIHKDAPETVKEALRLLTYTGIIRKIDSSIRATRSELGDRFEVKYGCILCLFNNPSSESKQFYSSLSVKKFPEFGKHYSAFSSIKDLNTAINDEDAFKISLEHMLKKPISVLQLLTDWQKQKLQEVGINTIEDLHQNTESNLIAKIYNVGPVRARLIKNAANAELLEYLSG
jgi:hypothetical protein